MHDGSMARVRLGSNLSTPFELQRGLKQGSVFAPLLFNIFFGAVIKACEHRYGGDPTLPPADTWSLHQACGGPVNSAEPLRRPLGVPFKWTPSARILESFDLMDYQKDGTTRTKTVFEHYRFTNIAFADDLQLLALSESDLQIMMDIFVEVVESFGQEVSLDKSKVMVSEHVPPGGTRSSPRILVHGKQLEVVDCFVYLGSQISWDCSLDGEIKRRCQRMYGSFAKWKHILCNRSITLPARLAIFRSVIVSNGIFGCEVWNPSTKNWKTLETAHFKLLRCVLGPKYRPASWTQLLAVVRKSAQKPQYTRSRQWL